ncbi:hypothetical protein SNEBB_003194 [Seison nebaliae]|nr:hypothetical protein SNEBB_003194 [Seison nebaliae]
MFYCSPNITLTELWIENGFNICLVDTISCSVILSWMLLFGVIQLIICRYQGREVPTEYLQNNNKYAIQIIFIFLMLFLSLFDMISIIVLTTPENLRGHSVLMFLTNFLSWSISLMLLHSEHRYLIWNNQKERHGIIFLIFILFQLLNCIPPIMSMNSNLWFWHFQSNLDLFRFIFWICRTIFCLFLFILSLYAPGIPKLLDDESLLLISNDESHVIDGNVNPSTWKSIRRKLSLILPNLWPTKSFWLQLCLFICFGILIVERFIGLQIPIVSKEIIDVLSGKHRIPNNTINFRDTSYHTDLTVWPWRLVMWFILFRFLQGAGVGSSGFLGSLRNLLWIKIQQFTKRSLQIRLFRHLHDLPIQWHLNRKTGEVLRVVDRGTNSLNNLLTYIIFNIIPILIDIIIAIIYFTIYFHYSFSIIISITMILYLIVTISVTEWRTKFRRQMNQKDNEMNAKAVDSLINFETVKYYNNEQFEIDRYDDAIKIYQFCELKSNASLALLNVVQNLTIVGGLSAGLLLAAYFTYMNEHQMTVGDYVLFGTYILQLYSPLNYFGTYYRMIQQAFIDMENMFDLLNAESNVTEMMNPIEYKSNYGMLEFNDVSFSYKEDEVVLKNINLSLLPGKSVAFVGPSGSGKSTLIRLIFRFYDVDKGEITIDGHNIKDLSFKSLRNAIGVVPQDTVLFNDTIRNNIRYGRFSATDLEVENAAKLSEIHNKILQMRDGYETVVGERGLKLSGGEKQRVAIARTILKSPRFILLDEATSALDSLTEKNIQESLSVMCEDRTTIIVAHRLSTIQNVDEICVLLNGEIVERGNHEELMSKGEDSCYYRMWKEQMSNEIGKDEN